MIRVARLLLLFEVVPTREVGVRGEVGERICKEQTAKYQMFLPSFLLSVMFSLFVCLFVAVFSLHITPLSFFWKKNFCIFVYVLCFSVCEYVFGNVDMRKIVDAHARNEVFLGSRGCLSVYSCGYILCISSFFFSFIP